MKELGIHGGSQFYQWLWNQKMPEGYQVLCWNCNALKRYENNEDHAKIPPAEFKAKESRKLSKSIDGGITFKTYADYLRWKKEAE